ncbi:MAG: DUF362 domain-containing protein [Acidobacteria bacterium]|nr:DUF362 domain-containing protein [Acidobacteriota bacterium]NIM60647.1 DUF362 domain-containing protein [Acidobacteriota bacterium]NIO57934.1 DUF362 domain-containing protein [Acidobacteriota bacterium]NIQ28937.1 DUF362 domain-containing protein [Acidobacteriota bacterium]NIQ83411.1 DUF362 domain-containing protein [Acidobacteriota bacterium]
MSSNPPGNRSVVAVEPVQRDIRGAVRRALDAIGWKDVIPQGSTVALKVNLGWDLFIPGSITSPAVLEALALELQPHVGRLIVVEADQVLENIERAYRESGVAAVCRRNGLEWVNMTHEPATLREFPENTILKTIAIPAVLDEALLVTVPVMKTHAKTTLTGALKNQWGCLPTMRHEYHLVLDDALADLNHVFRPALALMDATIGLEGNGPKSGRPRFADKILCSTDPVALDTIQAVLMGLDPASVTHLATCSARGIGVSDRSAIDVVGLDPEDNKLDFTPARHNTVSAVETLLRRSWLKRLFFNTPLFRACLVGAKAYYLAWTRLRARAHWSRVRRHPVYGPQWSDDWPGIEGSG